MTSTRRAHEPPFGHHGHQPARRAATLPPVILLLTAVVVAAACAPPSADDLVADVLELRNRYDVRLTSWIVRDEGGPDAHLYLDVAVVQNGPRGLDDLTVLVEQLDADGRMLRQDRVALDVSRLTSGLSRNLGVEVRPADPRVEGVRLYVEPDPPRDAWSEFPELEEVRPRI